MLHRPRAWIAPGPISGERLARPSDETHRERQQTHEDGFFPPRTGNPPPLSCLLVYEQKSRFSIKLFFQAKWYRHYSLLIHSYFPPSIVLAFIVLLCARTVCLLSPPVLLCNVAVSHPMYQCIPIISPLLVPTHLWTFCVLHLIVFISLCLFHVHVVEIASALSPFEDRILLWSGFESGPE